MPRSRLLTTTAAVAAAALLIAACNDDNGDDVVEDVRDEVEDVTDDVTDEVEDFVDDVRGENEVTIEDLEFDPANLEIDAGTSVTFTNEDAVPHTVTAGSPGNPTGEFSEELDPDDDASISFEDTGTFDYFCEIHNQMTGTVTVE